MRAESLVSTIELSRQDWLAYRQKGLGGSDCGTIMGVNKWKSKFQLYLEKTGEYVEEVNNEFVYWGNTLENLVAKEFELRSGKKVRRRNSMLVHPEHNFMMANLDRVVVGEKAILECKTTSAYNLGEWEGDEIPAVYLCQLQHYLAVTGYEKAYIAVLCGGNQFIWKEVPRDEELIEIIIKNERKFWEENVLAGVAPEIDGSSAATDLLKKLYPEDNGETLMLTNKEDQIIEALEAIKSELKELEMLKKKYENQLKMELEEAAQGLSPKYVVTYKAADRNDIDAKLLKAEAPELAKKYTKTTSVRTLRIKEVK
ncbi:YqaJ viral recombinase family protein [Planomicrobium okeanokoites]|uniref:YqaJ viral recombinase family nuclease n=1 Tax=Planomicrobium okeanokoites TaxID=244 RepID=UPI000A06312A|nr:YqaJ viral recombinase family protein [Planomicrobium okeanokoites]